MCQALWEVLYFPWEFYKLEMVPALMVYFQDDGIGTYEYLLRQLGKFISDEPT